MSDIHTRRAERAYFDSLPLCTRRAMEHALMQQLELRTLARAKSNLDGMPRNTRAITSVVER